MSKFFGIALAVVALAIAIVPQFTDCQSQGRAIQTASGTTVPMKCHWTGIAELVVAAPLLAVGIMTTLNRRKEAGKVLGVTGVILGLSSILLPTYLIGVCATPTMLCHTFMSPTLIIAGVVISGLSLTGAVMSFKRKE